MTTMTESRDIVIPLDKTKIMLFVMLLIALGIMGIWILQNLSFFTNSLAHHYALPAGIAFVIFAPVFGGYFVTKLFDKSPGFIISNKGITDNSSMTSRGFIPWAEIASIDETQVFIRQCITLILKEPAQYKNPVLLTPGILHCSYEELLSWLNEGLAKYNASINDQEISIPT